MICERDLKIIKWLKSVYHSDYYNYYIIKEFTEKSIVESEFKRQKEMPLYVFI